MNQTNNLLIAEPDGPVMLSSNDFGMLLVFATRYALGRSSYAVDYCCELLERKLAYLSAADLHLLYTEVDAAVTAAEAKNATVGHGCDHRTWRKFVDTVRSRLVELVGPPVTL